MSRSLTTHFDCTVAPDDNYGDHVLVVQLNDASLAGPDRRQSCVSSSAGWHNSSEDWTPNANA